MSKDRLLAQYELMAQRDQELQKITTTIPDSPERKKQLYIVYSNYRKAISELAETHTIQSNPIAPKMIHTSQEMHVVTPVMPSIYRSTEPQETSESDKIAQDAIRKYKFSKEYKDLQKRLQYHRENIEKQCFLIKHYKRGLSYPDITQIYVVSHTKAIRNAKQDKEKSLEWYERIICQIETKYPNFRARESYWSKINQ